MRLERQAGQTVQGIAGYVRDFGFHLECIEIKSILLLIAYEALYDLTSLPTSSLALSP